MIRGNNEAQTASDTNSTGCVGRAPDQAGYQLACTEMWSGNNISDELLKLPGLVGLVHSEPVEPATSGGDVYYVSVCDKRVLSRVVLADVAGPKVPSELPGAAADIFVHPDLDPFRIARFGQKSQEFQLLSKCTGINCAVASAPL